MARHRQPRQWRSRNPLIVAVAAALLASGLTLATLSPARPTTEYTMLPPPGPTRAPLSKTLPTPSATPTPTPTPTRGTPHGAGMGPNGATARCGDGELVYGPRPREHRACAGHGGLARVYD